MNFMAYFHDNKYKYYYYYIKPICQQARVLSFYPNVLEEYDTIKY